MTDQPWDWCGTSALPVLCARCGHPETWHTAIGLGGGSCYAPACPCDGFLTDPATLDALPGPHVFVEEDREPITVTTLAGGEITLWWAPTLGTWVTIPEDD